MTAPKRDTVFMSCNDVTNISCQPLPALTIATTRTGFHIADSRGCWLPPPSENSDRKYTPDYYDSISTSTPADSDTVEPIQQHGISELSISTVRIISSLFSNSRMMARVLLARIYEPTASVRDIARCVQIKKSEVCTNLQKAATIFPQLARICKCDDKPKQHKETNQ